MKTIRLCCGVFCQVLLMCCKVWSAFMYHVDAHTFLRILLQGTLFNFAVLLYCHLLQNFAAPNFPFLHQTLLCTMLPQQHSFLCHLRYYFYYYYHHYYYYYYYYYYYHYYYFYFYY